MRKKQKDIQLKNTRKSFWIKRIKQPPCLLYRGGCLRTVSVGSAPGSAPASYESIFLSNHYGTCGSNADDILNLCR